MKAKAVAAALSVLLYANGLLGVAALASVLVKDRAHAGEATVPAPPASHER